MPNSIDISDYTQDKVPSGSEFLNKNKTPTKLLGEFFEHLEVFITSGATKEIISGNSATKALNEINSIKESLRIKTKCVELMIGNPDRSNEGGAALNFSTLTGRGLQYMINEQEKGDMFYNIPCIVVYNRGKLIYSNDMYRAMVRVDSFDELKALANSPENTPENNLLVEAAYSGDMKAKVYEFTKNLKRGEGYDYVNFTIGNSEDFQRTYSWSSYGLNNGTGSVRIGLDVTDELDGLEEGEANDHMIENYKSKRLDGIPLGFCKDLNNLRTNLRGLIGDNFQNQKFVEIYNDLIIIAEMGDVLFDKGPFMMSIWKDGKILHTNPVYTGVTGYTLAEMNELISQEDGFVEIKGEKVKVSKFMTNLYGRGTELQMVLQRVRGLSPESQHYYEQFFMHPKPSLSNKDRENAWKNTFFDTYLLTPGSSFRVGRVQPESKFDLESCFLM